MRKREMGKPFWLAKQLNCKLSISTLARAKQLTGCHLKVDMTYKYDIHTYTRTHTHTKTPSHSRVHMQSIKFVVNSTAYLP